MQLAVHLKLCFFFPSFLVESVIQLGPSPSLNSTSLYMSETKAKIFSSHHPKLALVLWQMGKEQESQHNFYCSVKDTPLLDSRYEKIISFHVSGTPGRHQWLQSGTDGWSLQIPKWASLRNAPIGVTCSTVTGVVIFFTTLIIMSENRLRSLPWDVNDGRLFTLQEFRFWPLAKIKKTVLSLQNFWKDTSGISTHSQLKKPWKLFKRISWKNSGFDHWQRLKKQFYQSRISGKIQVGLVLIRSLRSLESYSRE